MKKIRHEFKLPEMDFTLAGNASLQIKKLIQEKTTDADMVRRAAIACYEAEINAVVYGRDGVMTLEITENDFYIFVEDKGDGIPDIEQAMMEGFSTAPDEVREMGFGAGMGLPNIMKNADEFTISSAQGEGTRLKIIFRGG